MEEASGIVTILGNGVRVGHETFGQQGRRLARKILCRVIHADELLET